MARHYVGPISQLCESLYQFFIVYDRTHSWLLNFSIGVFKSDTPLFDWTLYYSGPSGRSTSYVSDRYCNLTFSNDCYNWASLSPTFVVKPSTCLLLRASCPTDGRFSTLSATSKAKLPIYDITGKSIVLYAPTNIPNFQCTLSVSTRRSPEAVKKTISYFRLWW